MGRAHIEHSTFLETLLGRPAADSPWRPSAIAFGAWCREAGLAEEMKSRLDRHV